MLTACLHILLTVSACTGLFAETDLGSKERKGMAMRDWKKLSDEEKAEWKARAQAKERKRKRSLSDSALDGNQGKGRIGQSAGIDLRGS